MTSKDKGWRKLGQLFSLVLTSAFVGRNSSQGLEFSGELPRAYVEAFRNLLNGIIACLQGLLRVEYEELINELVERERVAFQRIIDLAFGGVQTIEKLSCIALALVLRRFVEIVEERPKGFVDTYLLQCFRQVMERGQSRVLVLRLWGKELGKGSMNHGQDGAVFGHGMGDPKLGLPADRLDLIVEGEHSFFQIATMIPTALKRAVNSCRSKGDKAAISRKKMEGHWQGRKPK